MIIEAQGVYDALLNARLLPLMQEHQVTAYIQGHRHTLEHTQVSKKTEESDVHFFTIGAGALLDAGALLWPTVFK